MNSPASAVVRGDIADPPGADHHELADAGVVDALVIRSVSRSRPGADWYSRRARLRGDSYATRSVKGGLCRPALPSRRAERLPVPPSEKLPCHRRRCSDEHHPRQDERRSATDESDPGTPRSASARATACQRPSKDHHPASAQRPATSRPGTVTRALHAPPLVRPAGFADGLAHCATPNYSAIRPRDHVDRCGPPFTGHGWSGDWAGLCARGTDHWDQRNPDSQGVSQSSVRTGFESVPTPST